MYYIEVESDWIFICEAQILEEEQSIIKKLGSERIVKLKFLKTIVNTDPEENGYETRKDPILTFSRNLCRNEQDLIEKLFYLQR